MATKTTPFGEQPAFPCGVPVEKYDDGQTRRTASGITARDWFAAQALAGILAGPAVPLNEYEKAARAYRHADAMLVMREQKSE